VISVRARAKAKRRKRVIGRRRTHIRKKVTARVMYWPVVRVLLGSLILKTIYKNKYILYRVTRSLLVFFRRAAVRNYGEESIAVWE
jgi:hypothetical protein